MVAGARQADSLVKALDTRVASGDTANLGGVITATGALLLATDAQVASSLPTLVGQVHGIERTLGFQSALNDARVAADRLPLLASTTTLTTWMQGSYLDGDLSRAGYASADYTQRATTVGFDMPLGGAGTIAGAALTSGEDRGTISASASRLRADRYAMTAYLYQPVGMAYLSAIGSYGMGSVETERSVQAGSIGERLQDRRHDTNWSLRTELGLLPRAGLSPFVAAGVVSQTQDAFSEASVTGLGLSAASDTLRAGYGEVGVRGHLAHGKWGLTAWLPIARCLATTAPTSPPGSPACPRRGSPLPVSRCPRKRCVHRSACATASATRSRCTAMWVPSVAVPMPAASMPMSACAGSSEARRVTGDKQKAPALPGPLLFQHCNRDRIRSSNPRSPARHTRSGHRH